MSHHTHVRLAAEALLMVIACIVLLAGCEDRSGPGVIASPDAKSFAQEKKPPPPPPPTPADPGIAFSGPVPREGDWLSVMNVDGSNLAALVPGGGLSSWSPDGDAIAFEGGNYYAGDLGIWRVEISVVDGVPTGTNARLLLFGFVGYPAWSPLGDQIAFADYEIDPTRTIEVIPANGGTREVLYTSVGGAPVKFPTWSPDGSRIAFAEETATGQVIKVLEVATREVSTVLDEATGEQIGGFAGESVDWAHTRDALVFQTGHGGWRGYNAVYTLDLPDGAPTFVVGGWKRTRAATPCWSPDDQAIIYAKDWRFLRKIELATGVITDLEVDGKFPDCRRP